MELTDMRAMLAGLAVIVASAATTIPADAKGCIKGAVVGGIAGHYAGHHAVLGAAAGCLVGRHAAKQHERAMQNPSPDQAH
jgi:outer membrane lipoprotein SlyB